MAYTTRLGDLPAGGTPYTPTAAERANAAYWLTSLGYTLADGAWSNQDGGVFNVPTTDGGYVRFGWGRGDFANFPGPGEVTEAAAPVAVAPQVSIAAPVEPAPAAAVTVAPTVTAAPASVAVAAATTPYYAHSGPVAGSILDPCATLGWRMMRAGDVLTDAPASVATTAAVVTPTGTTPVAAVVSTVPDTSEAVAAAPVVSANAPATATGFDFSAFLTALLKAPAMQPVEANVAAAAAPYAPQVATSLLGAWVDQNKALVYGGAAVLALGVVLLATRKRRA